ncbi:hypothetical protein [Bacillus sp. T33-2]|uniref:hypothetical protein n=1 Tax=Bacillus sp. T33-2 TaxID=2054168 RepID=UPI00215549B9|nr:hypothetical protein [Bacillus sp. T33-2]
MDEMEEGEIRELLDIFVTAKKHHIPRLILYKLAPEQIKKREKKREKTEKKRGVKLSHPTKKLYKLNMFISNIPYQSVPKEEIPFSTPFVGKLKSCSRHGSPCSRFIK